MLYSSFSPIEPFYGTLSLLFTLDFIDLQGFILKKQLSIVMNSSQIYLRLEKRKSVRGVVRCLNREGVILLPRRVPSVRSFVIRLPIICSSALALESNSISVFSVSHILLLRCLILVSLYGSFSIVYGSPFDHLIVFFQRLIFPALIDKFYEKKYWFISLFFHIATVIIHCYLQGT